MIKECQLANESCKYFTRSPKKGGNIENGCYTDLDHKTPQRLAKTTLASLFIYSPENLQQLCRREHDEKTLAGDEPLPSREEMLESLRRQIKLGKLAVSKQMKRKIMKGRI